MTARRAGWQVAGVRARVIIKLPDGSVVELGPGSIIGRMRRCELFIDDGRLSEAHALVSLRGGALVLLPLRGRLSLRDQAVSSLELESGQRIELAPGVVLEVLEVVLPDELLALRWGPLPEQVLLGTTSLVVSPSPGFRPGWVPDAAAWAWSDGSGFRLQVGGLRPGPLLPGDRAEIGGFHLEALARPLALASSAETFGVSPGPLKVVAHVQTVHLFRDGQPVVVLDGAPAQCISELVSFRGPVSWEVCARELWGAAVDTTLLRGRWDAMLLRLRRRLRSVRVRDDLVRCDRQGFVELVLHPGDELVDET